MLLLVLCVLQYVNGDTYAFVEFYAPCKNLSLNSN